MSNVVALQVQFEPLTCWSCGMSFAVPWMVTKKRREDGKTFWCPAGCRLVFGKSEVDRLREEVEAKQREIERQRERVAWAQRQTDMERRSHAATRGHATRVKKRIANGVCPCCNRSFTNLARHMKSKHPQFDTDGAS